ncbi:unnamed protein product [Ectocarpus sp. 4 AP-2014]
MFGINDNGWLSARKSTSRPAGPVRNGFVVVNAPEYDERRIRALQNKRYRRSTTYEKHLKARKIDEVYRWRVFKEQARRRGIEVSITFEQYSSIVRRACWYCGQFSYKKGNVVACCKTCNFMKGPLSVDEFLRKVNHIAREQRLSVE